jgi:hypothetical protein
LQELVNAEALEQCVDQHQVKRAQAEELERLQRTGDDRCPEPGDGQAVSEELAQLQIV